MAQQMCDWLVEASKLLDHAVESDSLRTLSEPPVNTAFSGENDVFADARHRDATVSGLFVNEQFSKFVGARMAMADSPGTHRTLSLP